MPYGLLLKDGYPAMKHIQCSTGQTTSRKFRLRVQLSKPPVRPVKLQRLQQYQRNTIFVIHIQFIRKEKLLSAQQFLNLIELLMYFTSDRFNLHTHYTFRAQRQQEISPQWKCWLQSCRQTVHRTTLHFRFQTGYHHCSEKETSTIYD